MERMSGLDAFFLYFETPNMHMHVMGVIVFDPSTVPEGYSFGLVKDKMSKRLHLVPPFRRKLAPVPFNLHHPVWVEDADFDLDYHIRRIGCPEPGGERELAELVGDIASRPLDRSRPLWEMYIVEGLQNGYVASVAKMHHCTTDGVSGANLMVHLFDLEPNPAEDKGADAPWEPDRMPTDIERIGYAVASRLRRPLNLFKVLPATAQSVMNVVQRRRGGDGSGMAMPFSAPRTSFNQPITPHRRTAFSTTSLDEVKEIKKAFGVTVNDVVLTIVSTALRKYLEGRDELPDKSLIATCPVSVRTEEEKIGSNQVSAMFTSLATDIEDPVERLRAIHESSKGAKEEHNAIGADILSNWGEFAAPTTFALAARMYTALRLAERHPVIHNLVISNVPGPPFPLYFAGAKLVGLNPLGPIFDGAGLNITVLSYVDNINWGFIACRELMPDLWNLADAIPQAQAELLKAAQSIATNA